MGIAPFIGNTTLYATYKESSRTPSVAELSCADPDQPCRLPNSFQADPPLDQVKIEALNLEQEVTKVVIAFWVWIII